MRVLAVGDVVGPAGLEYIEANLRGFARSNNIDLTIVNGENVSKGNGISSNDARYLLAAGADVITTGNHVWKKNDIRNLLDESEYLLRPANYPDSCPGKGYTVIEVGLKRVLVINLMGVSYLEPLASPFDTLEGILNKYKGEYDYSIVDFHAEATGEKGALANCFDGRIDAIFGTHTHVQTADARTLPCGTAYITDVGMTGAEDSILGVCKENIIEKLRTHMPVRFEAAGGKIVACGAIFELDEPRSCVAVRF